MKNRTEKGITLIALIIMIIVLVIIVAISLKALGGENGLIVTSTKTAEEHNIAEYKEQIEHSLQGTVLSYITRGDEPNLENIANDIKSGNDWVKSSVANLDESITNPDIIITTNDGYVFQSYYDTLYGVAFVEYIGKDDGKQIPNLKTKYIGKVAAISTEATDNQNGIAKTELIYRQKIENTVTENLNKEVRFDVEPLGTGWFVIRTTSNAGKMRYAWIRVASVSDKLKAPTIILNPAVPNGRNEWYTTEVEVTLENNEEEAKEIRYMLVPNLEEVDLDKILNESDINAGNKYEGPFKITNNGTTKILAWVVDETGKYRSEYAREELKIDTKGPEIIGIKAEGVEPKETGWYTEKYINVEIDANDEGSGIDKYYYKKGTEWIQLIDAKLPRIEEDGIINISVKVVDKAGNETIKENIQIKKDSKPPEVKSPLSISNQTTSSMKATANIQDPVPGSTSDGGKIKYECWRTEIKNSGDGERVRVRRKRHRNI